MTGSAVLRPADDGNSEPSAIQPWAGTRAERPAEESQAVTRNDGEMGRRLEEARSRLRQTIPPPQDPGADEPQE